MPSYVGRDGKVHWEPSELDLEFERRVDGRFTPGLYSEGSDGYCDCDIPAPVRGCTLLLPVGPFSAGFHRY
jgi:hypothetical protein